MLERLINSKVPLGKTYKDNYKVEKYICRFDDSAVSHNTINK